MADALVVPVKIVVVYHSGYGHTARIAEAVARGAAAIRGASVELVTAEEAPSRWGILDGADGTHRCKSNARRPGSVAL